MLGIGYLLPYSFGVEKPYKCSLISLNTYETVRNL